MQVKGFHRPPKGTINGSFEAVLLRAALGTKRAAQANIKGSVFSVNGRPNGRPPFCPLRARPWGVKGRPWAALTAAPLFPLEGHALGVSRAALTAALLFFPGNQGTSQGRAWCSESLGSVREKHPGAH